MENNFVDILEEFVEKNQSTTETVDNNEIENASINEENATPFQEEIDQYKVQAYDDLLDKYLRQGAEYDNFRKRTLKEKEELRQSGHQKAVEAILPIIDDFDRALNNISEEAKEGVQLIYSKFITTLKTLGVERMKIINMETPFDTELHEAVTMVTVDNEELNGKIVDCVQRGYTLNGKIIRHPKVVVGEIKNK